MKLQNYSVLYVVDSGKHNIIYSMQRSTVEKYVS